MTQDDAIETLERIDQPDGPVEEVGPSQDQTAREGVLHREIVSVRRMLMKRGLGFTDKVDVSFVGEVEHALGKLETALTAERTRRVKAEHERDQAQADAAVMREALEEVTTCLEDVASGKGGWAWEEVLDSARTLLSTPHPGQALLKEREALRRALNNACSHCSSCHGSGLAPDWEGMLIPGPNEFPPPLTPCRTCKTWRGALSTHPGKALLEKREKKK